MSKTTKIGLVMFGLLLVAFPLRTNPYIVQIAITWMTFAMLGLDFAFSMKAGLPRIDIAAWWSIGGFTTALLMHKGLNFFVAALIAGIICMILGWIVFSFIIPRGVTIFFMLSLVFIFAAPSLMRFMFMIPFLRGGGGGPLTVNLGPLQLASKTSLYYLGVIFMGVNIAVFYLLYNSKIGAAWNAINSSLKLARSLGVRDVSYRLANMVIGNFFISLAGSYLIAYAHDAPPLIFSLQTGALIMMYAFIGGLYHSFSGPLLGALLLTFIPEYFRMANEYEPIITAILTVLVIIFMPAGILGWLDQKLYPWLRRNRWYIQINKRGTEEAAETLQ
jgi:branched-chain amino acid transport system permease protein